MPFAIAIDGPAGVGKSTTARRVAEKMGMQYIDTGSMYRAIALYCVRNGIDPKNETDVTAALHNIDVELTPGYIYLNGEDITGAIRSQEISDATSTISPYSAVREKMSAKQKTMVTKGETVMDGRDIGSYVIPWAQVKIYLDADVDIRASRRAKDLKAAGKPVDMNQLRQEIIDRDHRDSTREHSPLTQAKDAIYIDTGKMTKDEVVEEIIRHIKSSRR